LAGYPVLFLTFRARLLGHLLSILSIPEQENYRIGRVLPSSLNGKFSDSATSLPRCPMIMCSYLLVFSIIYSYTEHLQSLYLFISSLCMFILVLLF